MDYRSLRIDGVKMKKFDDFNLNDIFNALDACEFNLSKTASMLGIAGHTMRKWARDKEQVRKYIAFRTADDAARARDRLNEILESADINDPKVMGHVVSVCKILLDKNEADKQEVESNVNINIDKELDIKLRKLLGE